MSSSSVDVVRHTGEKGAASLSYSRKGEGRPQEKARIVHGRQLGAPDREARKASQRSGSCQIMEESPVCTANQTHKTLAIHLMWPSYLLDRKIDPERLTVLPEVTAWELTLSSVA